MIERFSPLAVIVTYNPEFSKTFRNVLNLNENKVPVLIVDNHSRNTEEIRPQIKKPNLFLENPKNLGLGFALNKGIEYAKKNGYSHVWLFDQDSLLESEAIRFFLEKVKSFEQDAPLAKKKVASFGPNIFDSVKNRNIYGLKKISDAFLDASFLITSGSFYPLYVFEEVGPIQEDFFIDYLDYEWCFRANYKGYVHKIIAASKMNHSIGNRSKNIFGIFKIAIHSPFRWYFLFRNGIWMCKLPHVPFRFKSDILIKSFLRLLLLPFFGGSIIKTFRHILHGIRDGFAGGQSSFYRNLVGADSDSGSR
ncbi:glycosyltransferase family 2 protein [Leptospira sanjuanensis]|uniref:glycosyltransferase family 2 protein n=1 Tax=Leptospira sanjuanensis TaxID=2879643 RepID=UPI001EE94DA5|nr:glycosyltransferase family 2 protein [Leptospira sanjuanensis]MCG6167635.1 glycosyltransferase family 2 protein [Leptospira sanjuanensis]